MMFKVQDEKTDLPCWFDFESFVFGSHCEKMATRVIIDTHDPNAPEFHIAHLCDEHALSTLLALE